MAKTVDMILELYEERMLDMTGFEMGSKGDEEDYDDGGRGNCHLAAQLTLYTRHT